MRHSVFLVSLLLLFLGGIATAQDSSDSLFVHPFDELTVTATRTEALLSVVPRSVALIGAPEIAERGYHTTPDILREMPGVLVQKTNLGGGSPFVRGLAGKQVLVLIDGIRLNNSIYRYGPTQYLNTVDPYAVGQLEVVFGPGSVLYGSDALGGVVNVRSRAVGPGESFSGRVYQRLASAERSYVNRLDLDARFGKSTITVGSSYKHFGDLRAGAGDSPVGAVDVDGVQPYTGYEEVNLNAAVEVPAGQNGRFRAAYLFTRQPEVPKSNNLIVNDYFSIPDLVNHFSPQQLHFGYLKYEFDNPAEWASGSAFVTANVQLEGRERRKTGWEYTEFEKDNVRTVGAGFQVSTREWRNQTLTGGAEYYSDLIGSTAYRALDPGGEESMTGRFPDGTTYSTFGTYLRDEWSPNPRLATHVGVRYSRFHIASDLGGVQVGPIGPLKDVEETYSDITWSLEQRFELTPGDNMYVSVARGFRAPNVDDLAVDGAWDSGRDVPNPDVDPEKVIQYEVGLKTSGRHGALRMAIFDNRYTDLIQRSPVATVDGEDIFQFSNVGKAQIRGAEMAGSRILSRSEAGFWSLDGHVSYIWGKNITDAEPIRRIPPPLGKLGLRWDGSAGHSWIEVYAVGALKQDRLSGGDIRDERIPEGGTPGWTTLNVRGGLAVLDWVTLTTSVENTFNKRYRWHGSGIDAPGINIVAGIVIKA